ncbi:hypothetical protein IEQ34_013982 [Dendrobium chrysotoxum]|uniref:Uncharacterized protein n=1 Tax=Dendrobium chrysotoxum TaxID=161865 RepID=A0AAV7G1U5_DENCH|nr:hypothetical protein IEQ34_013982 [Dendrobium chrysotoxum]
MGASESVASKLNQQPPIDQITTVSERIENADPMLERIQALKIATPLLRSQTPSEGSLTDILIRKPSSSSNSNIPGEIGRWWSKDHNSAIAVKGPYSSNRGRMTIIKRRCLVDHSKATWSVSSGVRVVAFGGLAEAVGRWFDGEDQNVAQWDPSFPSSIFIFLKCSTLIRECRLNLAYTLVILQLSFGLYHMTVKGQAYFKSAGLEHSFNAFIGRAYWSRLIISTHCSHYLMKVGGETNYPKSKSCNVSQKDKASSLNPNVLLELFSTYREWQVEKAKKISQRQEEIENKIETADALAGKLLQRFNYSASSMRTTAHSLTEVHQLQIEVGELKGRLTEVISNCDALCKRIAAEGPESLRRSAEPFSARGISSTNHFSSRNKS